MIVIRDDTLTVVDEAGRQTQHSIGSPEAFSILSRLWLRSGWDMKYVYSFTWLGRPIIQLPEDLIRVQEVIHRVRPDVIVETGVAHGGSLVFYASLCRVMGRGRVIGIDVEIRPHNRAAIDAHELRDLITLIEGDSTAPEVVERVRREVQPHERTFLMFDARHTRDHVLAELEAYGPLLTTGSYMVAADGIMASLAGAPRSQADWVWNNPKNAARDFVANHPEFEIAEPEFAFNEGRVCERVTYWPGAFIRRRGGRIALRQR